MQKYYVVVISEDEEIDIEITARDEVDALKRTLIYIANEERKQNKELYRKLFS